MASNWLPNRRSLIYFAFSIGTSAVIFSYLLKFVSLEQIAELLGGVDAGGLMLFVALSLLTSYLHMCRYRLLLRSSGFTPGALPLFLTVLVRNLFSDLLPARAGTAVYIYLAVSRLGINLVSAASSFSLVFLFDVFAIAPLVLIAAWRSAGDAGFSSVALFTAAAIFGGIAFILILFLPRAVIFATHMLNLLPGMSAAFHEKLDKFSAALCSDINSLRASGIYLKVLALSLLVRLSKYLSLYVFLIAMLLPLGHSVETLPFSRAFLGLCSAEFAASLPISGIAGFGVYEGAWALAFNILGLTAETAISTGIAHHLFTQLYGYTLGAAALLLLLLPMFSKKQSGGLLRPG